MKSKYKEIINTMAVVVLVAGIIGTMVIAYLLGVDFELGSYSYRIYTERNWGLTILYLLGGGFITSVEYIIMRGIGECLDFQEKLYEKIEKVSIREENNFDKCELPPL